MLDSCEAKTFQSPYPQCCHHQREVSGRVRTRLQLFDPGIQRRSSLPLEPPPPPPLLKPVSNPHKGPSSQVGKLVKPNVPPKPGSVIPHSNQGVVSLEKGSEMESDDYRHISEQLHRAANKINKTRLALDLQDRERQPPLPVVRK